MDYAEKKIIEYDYWDKKDALIHLSWGRKKENYLVHLSWEQ